MHSLRWSLGTAVLALVLPACSVVGYPAGAPGGATPAPAAPGTSGEVRPGGGGPAGRPTEAPPDPDSVPDAVPVAEPPSRYGNPPEYEVDGRTYRVLDSSEGYVEEGLASWYGQEFHGRRTSSGEPYDMYAMTAAHRTLPLPSYVEVTNLENGLSVVVRVNDRGPFHPDRIIDVSYVAARRLGIVGAGTGRVRVRALAPTAR